MKQNNIEIGESVIATSRHAYGPVSLPKAKSVKGYISRISRAGIGVSLPLYTVADFQTSHTLGKFYESEIEIAL